MKKEKIDLYDTLWKVLASGVQYIGIYLGVSSICSNLANLYINSHRFLKKTDLREIIDGPYTTTALIGGLMFVTGSLVRDYIRRNETKANKKDIEEVVASGLESHRNKLDRTLEMQRTYIMVCANVIENALNYRGDTSRLEKDITRLRQIRGELIDSNPPSYKDKVYQEQY